MQLIVITGLSGAGKGLATRHFEDFGFFCVDNLPPMLIASFAELLERGKIGKAALVVDVRGGEFFPELIQALDDLQKRELEFQTLFLDCDDDALLKRFSETRRKHPLDDGGGLIAAIECERELLVPLRERADKVINTSRVTPRELRAEIERTFVSREALANAGMLIQVESFGFKHGPHASADLVFDVRFLPNPNYDREIGHLDGFEKPVIDYVMREPVTEEFLTHWQDFLSFVIPQFSNEGKAYLTIAVGCTGGRHRSVALSNWLGAWLRDSGFRVQVSHRDLVRGPQTVAPAPTSTQSAPSQTFGAPTPGARTDADPKIASPSDEATLLGEDMRR
ncbi:nucleotide-binding protein [Abditibacteriota bacterium]|nr:nucleotide-binding protein [Abditibacteriota bacterium]